MQIQSFLLTLQKQISGVQRFILIILFVATLNFGQMFCSYSKYDFHYGAPMNFFPRFFVCIFLAIACTDNFVKNAKGKVISLFGLAGAFLAYLNWWVSSYEQLKRCSNERMDFLNSPEFQQVAYLWMGNWLDVILVIFIFIALILQTERLAVKKFRIL
jgi:hypothetical protein